MAGDEKKDNQTATMRLTGFGDEVHPDPAVQVAVLQVLGASAMEVREVWGRNVVTLSNAELAKLASLCEDVEIGVSSVASPVGKSELNAPPDEETERLERALHAARVLQADYVRVFSFYVASGTWDSARPEVLKRVANFTRAAEKAGKTLVLENEKGVYGDVPTRLYDIVRTIESPALRIAWDPANFVQVGVVPFRDGYELLQPYISYVHVKDARLADGGVTLPGVGDGQLPETLAALRRSEYCGFVSLEPHLMSAYETSGFSGARAFGEAARAFASLSRREGVRLI